MSSVNVKSGQRVSIMAIPEEIRGKIFNKLPQQQALNLRLVCKQFQQEIDQYFKFNIELDDQKSKPEELNQLLDLRVEKCKILSFLNPPERTSSFEDREQIFFKYPKFLKNLEIADGQIAPNYLYCLMQECSHYLEELKISLTDGSTLWKLKNLSPSGLPQYRHNFQNLSNLCLIDNRSLENYKDTQLEQQFAENNDIFLHILENASLARLNCLEIRFISHFGIDHTIALKFTAAILSLIAKQFKTLQKLLVYCYVARDRNWKTRDLNASDLERIDMNLLKNVTSLKQIDIVIDGCIAPAAMNLWLDLLDCQKHLEKLRFKMTPKEYPLIRRIINSNYTSLSSISIKFDMSTGSGENIIPFDLSVFQICINLKILYLDGDFRTRVDVINFQKLPTNIQKLHIFTIGISTVEADSWFSLDLKELKDLHFSVCGTDGRGFGVGIQTLERILKLPNVFKIKLYESVSLVVGDNEETIYMDAPTVSKILGEDFPDFRNIRLERGSISEPLGSI